MRYGCQIFVARLLNISLHRCCTLFVNVSAVCICLNQRTLSPFRAVNSWRILIARLFYQWNTLAVYLYTRSSAYSLLVNYENPYPGRRTGPITSDYTAISYLPGVPGYERSYREKGDERKSYSDRLRYSPLPTRYSMQLDPTTGNLITRIHGFDAAQQNLQDDPR